MAQYGAFVMLSFTITHELNQQLAQLDERLVVACYKINGLSESALTEVQRFARISMVGASTRIENAQLTDSEVEWLDTQLADDGKTTGYVSQQYLIKDKLSKDRERSIEEVAGCRAMILFIYQNAVSLVPLRETDIRMLHDQLMSIYLKKSPYVGRYKIQPNSVVATDHNLGTSRTVFQTADPGPITEVAMAELVAWYNENRQSKEPGIAVVAEFVYRFLAIHPFQDGNGRLGRGLFLLGLLQCNSAAMRCVAPCLAIDRQIEKNKEEYYFVLNRCSGGRFSADATAYQIEHFFQFMLKVLLQALDDIDLYIEKLKLKQKLSVSALQVLTCFKEHPEIRLSTKRIMDETALPRRTVVNVLNKLLEAGFIQRYGQGAGTVYQVTF